MPIRPLASAPEATTRLMACTSPWSHVRRRNLRSRKLTRQHLHLCLSHSRKSPKKRNLKKWRSLYCLMMMMGRMPLKRMSRSLPWDGLHRSGTSHYFIPGDNQSQYEHHEITPRFILRFTYLPISYVLVVLTVHLVVH